MNQYTQEINNGRSAATLPPDLATVTARLRGRRANLALARDASRAAVALILGRDAEGLKLLFIERARHEADPWSGDLAFPGGRVSSVDNGAREAAERETLEETGLILEQESRLGRLDDMPGAHLPIVVSCFAYALDGTPGLRLNHESVDAFWYPLAFLLDPRRHRLAKVRFGGETLLRPALYLSEGRPVLWGITYRLVSHFFDLIGTPLPAPLPAGTEEGKGLNF